MKRVVIAAILLASCAGKRERYVNVTEAGFKKQGTVATVDGELFSGVSFGLYPNGDTAFTAGFLNGRQEGEAREFYPGARRKKLDYYMNGRACGLRYEWFAGGRRKMIAQLFNDQYEGRVQEWFPSGILYRDATYRNGQEDGQQKMYWSNGTLRANYHAVDGRKYGLTGVKNCEPAGVSLPYYNSADLTPLWNARTVGGLHTIAPFRFQSQTGAPIDSKRLNGKVYVANFFFTSCSGICLKMMRNLRGVADTFSRSCRVCFMSFTVDPARDSPTRLSVYAEQNRIDASRWNLLTGNKETIYSLARRSYYAEGDDGINRNAGEFLHTEHCFLVDRAGHLRGVYNGTVAMEMERMISDIRLLLRE